MLIGHIGQKPDHFLSAIRQRQLPHHIAHPVFAVVDLQCIFRHRHAVRARIHHRRRPTRPRLGRQMRLLERPLHHVVRRQAKQDPHTFGHVDNFRRLPGWRNRVVEHPWNNLQDMVQPLARFRQRRGPQILIGNIAQGCDQPQARHFTGYPRHHRLRPNPGRRPIRSNNLIGRRLQRLATQHRFRPPHRMRDSGVRYQRHKLPPDQRLGPQTEHLPSSAIGETDPPVAIIQSVEHQDPVRHAVHNGMKPNLTLLQTGGIGAGIGRPAKEIHRPTASHRHHRDGRIQQQG